ncbi:lysosomal proton-coupled steroid conjugate and bile acid symporter SLC46A3-like [Babylonia areolata]|uniref:lysosomal proton-coupled steroid conjugate and bile acid symporter SLC46A3-like n=1 Tax=Babylonia areolata TaxID=304850 RepID=UPI003FD1828C
MGYSKLAKIPVSSEDVSGESNNKQEESLVGWKEQIKRMVLLSLVGFLASCASRIFTPLVTQYTYQVYMERQFGNRSVVVDVSKKPCVANTSSSASSANEVVQTVQDLSADFLGRADLIDGSVGLVVNLLLGSYSDFLGRKLALFLPLMGHFLRLSTVVVVIYWDLGLPGLYVGYLLDGLLGGFPGLVMGLFSYMADITSYGGQRTVGSTLIEGCVGLGHALLYALAGLFIQQAGFLYPAMVAAALQLLSILLFLLLPETIPRDRKKVISPLKAVGRVVRTFIPRGQPEKKVLLLLAMLAFFINTLFKLGTIQLEYLYLMDHPFCWSSLTQGVWGSARYASSQLAGFLLVKVLRNVVSIPLLVILGSLSDMARNVLLALSHTDLQVYMGAMFAGIAILESVCQCLSQMTDSAIYTATLTFMSGFVFLALASVQLGVIFIYMFNYWLYRKYTKSHVTVFRVNTTGTQTDDVTDNGVQWTESCTTARRASV